MNKSMNILEMIENAEVEWKELGEVCEICNNMRKPVRKDLRNEGLIPYYGANNIQDYVHGYTHEGEHILIAEDGTKDIENYSIQWVTGKFWANNHVHIIKAKEKLINKFVYYYLQIFNFVPFLTGGTRAKLTKGKLETIPIPIPPLELQKEIVKRLDKMTNYVTELQAELQKRNSQYEYYRNLLLSEEYLNKLSENLEIIRKGRYSLKIASIGELTEVVIGGDVPKNNYSLTKTEEYSIPIYSNGTNEKSLYGYTNVAKVNQNSVTISARGSIGYVSYREAPYYPIVRLICLIPKKDLDVKYLYYLLQTIKFKHKETGIPSLTSDMVKKIKVKYPPIIIQNKIVEILDKFQDFLEDTKGLLPKEIEQRQKQYEYYREKLLTFNDNVVERERA